VSTALILDARRNEIDAWEQTSVEHQLALIGMASRAPARIVPTGQQMSAQLGASLRPRRGPEH
jgi:hypothetical protein